MIRALNATVLLTVLLIGCGGSAGTQSELAPTQTVVQQSSRVSHARDSASSSCLTKACIYVADPAPRRRDLNKLTVYAASANGNVTPIQTIYGSNTRLHYPTGVAVDANSNIYVANYTRDGLEPFSVTVYAAGASGNVAPIERISGSNTRLDYPNGIALDTGRNVYVSNPGFESVNVYASGANGNVAPIQQIIGSNTGLMNPEGIALDASGNIYVANEHHSVTVYAAGSNGNVAPIQTISGSNTQLDLPASIAVDASRNVYVANLNSSSVTVYAGGANGNVAPIQQIIGSNTGLKEPRGIAIDANNNIYVSNVGRSLTVYAAGANGNATPIRTVTGSNTGLHNPRGIAVR